jgi:Domain of unknown function (DUF932)
MLTNNTPLTNEQIQRYAPAAFAGQPWDRQSERYTFVPTSAVIDGMRANNFFPVKASQSRTRIAGKEFFTKHMIRFRAGDVQLSAVGDSVLEMVLVNSHDGSSAYELSAGVFRLACLNGMMVAESLLEAIHVRHTGNILEEVIDGSQKLLANGPVVSDTIKAWKGITLDSREQLALAESAHALRFEEDAAVRPVQLLTARRHNDAGTDLWSTFNRVQENTVRGGIRYVDAENHRRNRTREVKGISENVKLNRALWMLAEKMAQLKA